MKQRFHVIDALLQNKANPNDTNLVGWNCLISAVNCFHEDSASMLLLLLQVKLFF
jgi:ankyrin repeat protein